MIEAWVAGLPVPILTCRDTQIMTRGTLYLLSVFGRVGLLRSFKVQRRICNKHPCPSYILLYYVPSYATAKEGMIVTNVSHRYTEYMSMKPVVKIRLLSESVYTREIMV